MQSENIRETYAWLRERGFMADPAERLLIAMRGAIAALSQPHTYPGDIELARTFLRDAIAEHNRRVTTG